MPNYWSYLLKIKHFEAMPLQTSGPNKVKAGDKAQKYSNSPVIAIIEIEEGTKRYSKRCHLALHIHPFYRSKLAGEKQLVSVHQACNSLPRDWINERHEAVCRFGIGSAYQHNSNVQLPPEYQYQLEVLPILNVLRKRQ